jgi:ribonuclease T1
MMGLAGYSPRAPEHCVIVSVPRPMAYRTSNRPRTRYDPWLRAVVLAIVAALAIYSAWQRQQVLTPLERPTTPVTEERSPTTAPETDHASRSTLIAQQTIRDQDGRVAFRGDVDVGPTLERIRRGERLPFSHDGIVFQNREHRLPQKPPNYYHDFVHPTPKISGPGPQRIIVGGDGEIFYTPDHYRTFQRLDE